MNEDDSTPTLKAPRITPELLRALAAKKNVPSTADMDAAATRPVPAVPPPTNASPVPAPPVAASHVAQPASAPPPSAPPAPVAPAWVRDALPATDMSVPAEYDEVVPLRPGAPRPQPPPAPPQPPAAAPGPPVAAPAPPGPLPRYRPVQPAIPPATLAAARDLAPTTAHSATEEEDDMANVQWEYCRVQLDSGSYGQKQTIGRMPYFVRITIDYYGGDIVPPTAIGEDTDQIERPNRLWGQVLGLLGLANWEMINLYTGSAKDLALVNVMAYFKRPVIAGRKVNEPRITL